MFWSRYWVTTLGMINSFGWLFIIVSDESQKGRNSCLPLKLLAWSELLLIVVHRQINFNVIFQPFILFYSCFTHFVHGWLIFTDPYVMRHFVYGIYHLQSILQSILTNGKRGFWRANEKLHSKCYKRKKERKSIWK